MRNPHEEIAQLLSQTQLFQEKDPEEPLSKSAEIFRRKVFEGIEANGFFPADVKRWLRGMEDSRYSELKRKSKLRLSYVEVLKLVGAAVITEEDFAAIIRLAGYPFEPEYFELDKVILTLFQNFGMKDRNPVPCKGYHKKRPYPRCIQCDERRERISIYMDIIDIFDELNFDLKSIKEKYKDI